MTTTFSISLPVYQQVEFIKTALESLRCQTMPFELAVLDATPDDSVQNILRDYQDLISYQYHHADNGQSGAIQEGWNNIKGDIVAWLNADDYYFPDTLAKVAEIFQTRPDVDVVYGHSAYIDAQGTFQEYFPAISTDLTVLPRNNVICQPSCFVRRSAMERVGGVNPQLHYIMDWDLWIRLYQANCKFHFLDEMLSVVRIYPTTKTLSGSKKRFKEIDNLLKINASWRDRKIAWLGFLYDEYKYIKTNRKIFATLAYSLLSALRYIRIHLRKPSITSVVKGLACKTNRVEKQCEIILPQYTTSSVCKVNLVTDTNNKFNLIYEKEKIAFTQTTNLRQNHLNKKLMYYTYQAILPNNKQNILSLTINSDANQWRLLSLSIQ